MGFRPIRIADEEYALATRWQRVGGAVVDSLVLAVVMFAIAAASGFDFLGPLGDAVSGREAVFETPPPWFTALSIAVGAAYEIYLIGTRGQTLGKIIVGTRVIPTDHAGIPTFTVATIRWVVPAIATFLSSGLLFWLSAAVYVPVLFQDRGQGVHDMLAKTYVIKN